jgi:Tol biopolymer transport system component/drug/metabolite transporter (DMT)-like permease
LAALVCVSAIWGTTYVQVKDAVRLYPAFSFLALRFGIAVLAFVGLAAVLGARRRRVDRRDVGAGVLLGGVLAAGFALHVLGRARTSATTAGFVTGLLVPLTPIWAALVLRERAGRRVWFSVAIATAGAVLVSGGYVGSPAPSLLLFGGAVAFSLHIVLTRRFAVRSDPVALTTVQMLVAALALGAVAFVLEPVRVPSGDRVWAAIVVSALGGTALAFALQTWAQRRVSASKTAVVLTLEPVFCAAFGYALAGDRLGPLGVVGCVAILVAMFTSIGPSDAGAQTSGLSVPTPRLTVATQREAQMEYHQHRRLGLDDNAWRSGLIGKVVLVGVLAAAVTIGLCSGASPARAAFPGTNGKIAFRSDRDGNDEIYVMNADGSGETRLTNDSGYDGEPAWSPDGRKIAFTSYRDGDPEIYVMNADGSGQTNLTQNDVVDGSPAWSPDGQKIAFTSEVGIYGTFDIYVMNADGSGRANLTNYAAADDIVAAWSPDGQKIAFSSFRDGNWEVYVMNADGSGQTNLTNNAAASDHTPDWSPDGHEIAFASLSFTADYEVYVMNADGSAQTNLTNSHTATDWTPAWSPDGQKIAFSRGRYAGSEVYVMNADGSGQTDLTNNGASNLDPDWQPIRDSDGDGIPDARDVEAVQAAVDSLPIAAFRPPGGGTQNAIVSILDDVEAQIAAGNVEDALNLLGNLRRHLDGCPAVPSPGEVAERDDWIVDCDAQRSVRALIDTLIAELNS